MYISEMTILCVICGKKSDSDSENMKVQIKLLEC